MIALESQIKDQIQRATGHTLFHSFQTRKDTLANAKQFWVKCIVACLALAGAWTIWLSLTATFDTAFYLKLSVSLPLIFAISFCTKQYSNERKLEEEYAFKSNISVSLVAYKELIESILNKPDKSPEEQKYTEFIISSINKVFTSPTELVFSHKDKKEFDSKDLKDILSQFKGILKALK